MIDDYLIAILDERLRVTVAKKRADIPNGALTRGTIRLYLPKADLNSLLSLRE